MSEELRPCPFCGYSNSEIIYCEEDCCGAEPREISCPCGVYMLVNASTDEEAISQWNTRPETVSLSVVEEVIRGFSHVLDREIVMGNIGMIMDSIKKKAGL